MHTRVRHGHQICADPPEFVGGHGDSSSVLGFGDAKVLLVNVHELQVVFADTIILAALEYEVERVGVIIGLDSEDILILSSTQNPGEGAEVNAEGNVAVASVGREGFGLEHHGNESNVTVIHGLESNSRIVAIEVAILDEILDGINHLFQDISLFQSCLKHFCHQES